MDGGGLALAALPIWMMRTQLRARIPGGECADQPHRRDDVQVEHGRPVRGLRGRPAVTNASADVVDEDVDAPELRFDAADDRFAAVVPGQVPERDNCLAAAASDDRCRLLGPFPVAAVDGDDGAFAGEGRGDRPPDSAGAPGNESPLAVKLEIH